MIPAYFRSATARLAASYLAIIVVLSLSFSIVLYRTLSYEWNRLQIQPRYSIDQSPDRDLFEEFLEQRANDDRHAVIARLFLLNFLVFIAGAIVSQYLAKRTLQPIEETMEIQSRFTSDASHELRTPLTAIRAKNEVALRKPKLSAQDAKKVIKSNLDEVIKLQKLSDGLLMLSNGRRTKLEIKSVFINELANEAMNQVIEQAQAKDIEIEDSVPKLKVRADPTSTVQILTILLDNAIKYSNPKSKILLEGQKKGNVGLIAVIDAGMGIKPVDLPHIFERFYRADSSRSRKGIDGNGLGLAIAKNLVELQNGEITVKSRYGKGSNFSIKLPLADS